MWVSWDPLEYSVGVLGSFGIQCGGPGTLWNTVWVSWDPLEYSVGVLGPFRIAVWVSWDPLELQCVGPGTF